jgi:hypothetical protein
MQEQSRMICCRGRATGGIAAALAVLAVVAAPAVAQAANEAAPWSAPTFLSPANETAEGPSLGMLADGSLVATWTQDTADGWFPELASEPFAGIWSTADPISATPISQPLDVIGGARTAFAGDGRFVSTWLAPSAFQGVDVDGAVGSVKPGDAPSASPHTFAANTAGGGYLYGATTPQVVMSSDGSGTVEYTAASKTPSGGTFVGLTPINGGSPGDPEGGDAKYEFNPGPFSQTDFTGFNPSLAAAPLNAAWDASTSDDEALVATTPDGAFAAQVFETAAPSGWDGVTAVKPTNLSGATASVAVLADGATLVAENSGALSVWEPGDSTPVIVDNEDTIGYPSIAAFADGSATIAYLAYDNAANTDTVKEVTIANNGAASEPVTLSPSGIDVSGISTAYGPDGTTYVVWTSGDPNNAANDGIYASVRLPGGNFPTIPDTIVAGSTVHPGPPKAVVDATGYATVIAEVFDPGNGFRIAAFTHANPILPVNITAPAITPTGAPQVGAVLTCSKGAWTGLPNVFTFAWLRDGSPIGGAAQSSYTVASADAGHKLSCRVTATNRSGSGMATSAVVTPNAASAKLKVGTVTDKNGVVTVALSCVGTSGSCPTAMLALTVVEHLTGNKVTAVSARASKQKKKKNKKKKSKRSVVIAMAKDTLSAGENKTAKLSPNGAGRALLKAHHHLPAGLTVRAGKSLITTKKLTLVEPKPRHK